MRLNLPERHTNQRPLTIRRNQKRSHQATNDDARFQLDAKAAMQTFRLPLAGAAWAENLRESVPQTGTVQKAR
jgi:hypothetical protein